MLSCAKIDVCRIYTAQWVWGPEQTFKLEILLLLAEYCFVLFCFILYHSQLRQISIAVTSLSLKFSYIEIT